ncbi:MAG TPA: PH domain-containing protein [Thermoanaerobaculia bacterium]|nr:PH domain-containing protein [Thermoanaerobaculia bacterium]
MKALILRFFKVPPMPEPPPGAPPRIFRASPNYFKLRVIQWLFLQLPLPVIPALLTGLVWALTTKNDVPLFVVILLRGFEIIAWIAILAQLLLGWFVLRLDYEMRWYMVSDRAIRIREGIASVREKTLTLANIQNLSIRQGPLQRYLGIADLEVRTAGGGGGTEHQGKKGSHREPLHVAYFRGVDNANEIRELLRAGVRKQKDAGLGDHDDPVDHHHQSDDLQHAIAELREATRVLRESHLHR